MSVSSVVIILQYQVYKKLFRIQNSENLKNNIKYYSFYKMRGLSKIRKVKHRTIYNFGNGLFQEKLKL